MKTKHVTDVGTDQMGLADACEKYVLLYDQGFEPITNEIHAIIDALGEAPAVGLAEFIKQEKLVGIHQVTARKAWQAALTSRDSVLKYYEADKAAERAQQLPDIDPVLEKQVDELVEAEWAKKTVKPMQQQWISVSDAGWPKENGWYITMRTYQDKPKACQWDYDKFIGNKNVTLYKKLELPSAPEGE